MLNSAYEGAASSKWHNAPHYGVSASAVNSCSAAQLVAHRGMCNSYALTYLRLCRAADIGSDLRYVGCVVKGGASPDHALVAAKLDGKWRYIDVTWDDPLYTSPAGAEYERADAVSHEYFLKSRSFMVKTGHKLG